MSDPNLRIKSKSDTKEGDKSLIVTELVGEAVVIGSEELFLSGIDDAARETAEAVASAAETGVGLVVESGGEVATELAAACGEAAEAASDTIFEVIGDIVGSLFD